MCGMQHDDSSPVAGLLLAAGAGSRYGTPKALVIDESGESWLVRAALTLEAAGCDPVLVVLGAGGSEAQELLEASADRFARPARLLLVHTERWADGLSASLEAGLDRLQSENPGPPAGVQVAGLQVAGVPAAEVPEAAGAAPLVEAPLVTAPLVTAVLLVPVDVPDLNVATVTRLLGSTLAGAAVGPVRPDTLRQAHFGGRPGHPVVIGRDHWAALRASLGGDTGARPYLVAHGVTVVACDDLGTGLDVDSRAGEVE